MNILVVASHEAALIEYSKIFLNQSDLKPVFIVSSSSAYSDLLIKQGCVVYYGNPSVLHSKKAKKYSKLSSFLKMIADDTFFGCWFQHYLVCELLKKRELKKIERLKDWVVEVVERHNIEKVLIQSDRSLGLESAVLYAAKIKNIKVDLLSFAYSSDFKSAYKLRETKIYRFCKNLPSNVLYCDETLGKRAYYKRFQALALSELGVLSSNPWVLGGGATNKMYLDSERELHRLISLGGVREKYQVTGTCSQDDLYNAIFSSDIKTGKKTIVVALPQYYEHGLCSKEKHDEAIDGMMQVLKSYEYNVLISLHPKMNINDYRYIEHDFGFVLAEKPISDLIPLADLFLATYSSTVSLALLANKVVIICDHVDLNYTDFYSEFGLTVVKNNIDLNAQLKMISQNDFKPNYEVEKVKLLAPFDGKSKSRLISAILDQ